MRAVKYFVSSRVRLILKAFLKEENFKRIYAGKDIFTIKATAYSVYRQSVKELSLGAANSANATDLPTNIDDITEADLESLSDEALMSLAKNRYQGTNGVEKNLPLAVKAWTIASRKGNIEASYSLAACLREGVGIEKNPKEAFAILLPLAEGYQNPYAQVSNPKHFFCISASHSTPVESCFQMAKG
jgi:TPR repeat protein